VELFRDRIVKKAIDGEITALRIGFGIGKGDVFRMTTVLVIRLGAKGGDLELLFVLNETITPNLRPTATVRLNSFSTSSGRADVAMS
jgi:hypothetical protein